PTLHARYAPTPTHAAPTDARILPVLRWEILRASLVAALPLHFVALTVTASMLPSTRAVAPAPPPLLTPPLSPLLGIIWTKQKMANPVPPLPPHQDHPVIPL